MSPGARPRLLAVNHTALVAGAEILLLRALARARAEGWSVLVASPRGALVEHLRAAGLGHVELPDLMLPDGRPPLAGARLALAHAEAARRVRRAAAGADVVVANGIRVLPTARLSRTTTPTVWLAHNLVDRPRWRRVARACAPAVDLVVAGSEAVAASVRAAGARALPVHVVRYGTPWPVEPAPPTPPQPPVVGSVALLTPWKGHLVLLDALARMRRTDAALELVGGSFPKDGAHVAALQQRAVRPDLEGRVRFRGAVPDALPVLRTWAVAVVASTDPEGGPLSMLEAMSVGVPVVATDHGGPPELLGDAGLLVPPGDPAALAAALDRLLGDAALHRRCAARGPRLVAAGLRLEDQLAGLLDAFGTAAGSGRRR